MTQKLVTRKKPNAASTRRVGKKRTRTRTFDEVLDVVEELSFEERTSLVDIVKRRLTDEGRRRILEDVKRGRKEFARGECKVVTVDELMREILS